MLLIISTILAILPLLGIVWILSQDSMTTVDGLFMSLILLSISGIFGLNAWGEIRTRGRRAPGKVSAVAARSAAGVPLVRGLIEKVQFFEAHVGQPNKSVVTLSDGGGSPRLLVLEGDLRNRLPVGKRVEFTYREEDGVKTLVDADYL